MSSSMLTRFITTQSAVSVRGQLRSVVLLHPTKKVCWVRAAARPKIAASQ